MGSDELVRKRKKRASSAILLSKHIDHADLLVLPGHEVQLTQFDPGSPCDFRDKRDAKVKLRADIKQLFALQETFAPFKQPSPEELSHDYLWRCARVLSERGRIAIFNRSYFEELAVGESAKEGERLEQPAGVQMPSVTSVESSDFGRSISVASWHSGNHDVTIKLEMDYLLVDRIHDGRSAAAIAEFVESLGLRHEGHVMLHAPELGT